MAIKSGKTRKYVRLYHQKFWYGPGHTGYTTSAAYTY
jgi:hypothetical protein